MAQNPSVGRIEKLRGILREKQLEGALFTSYENRRYYSGFTGSGGYLIVGPDKVVLVTDMRYTEQAERQTEGVTVVEAVGDRQKFVAEQVTKLGLESIAFEDNTQAAEFFAIVGAMPDVRVELEGECFLEQRMVKDAGEAAAIREAIRCSDAAFAKLVPMLKAGMTEKEVADELHYLANKEGAETLSFGTIVAAGPNGAMAHHSPSQRPIAKGEMVVMDYGVMKDGYMSDTTRTLLFGDVDAQQMQTFELVYQSMQAAFSAIRPGVLAKDVEEAHREVFRAAGQEEYALKGLGHGVGLQVHECPRIVIGNETRLEAGMIFTVEPGLYYPGRYGVRTEDMVLVTESGYENLTKTPHKIQIER